MDYTITQVRNVLRNYEGLLVKRKSDHSKEGVSAFGVGADTANISKEAFQKLMASELQGK